MWVPQSELTAQGAPDGPSELSCLHQLKTAVWKNNTYVSNV